MRNARRLLVGVIVVLLSVAMLYSHVTRQKITTASDLKMVRGPFLGCFSGTRNNYCDISLQADYDTYRVPSDFLRCFDKDNFQSTVHSGDPLTILINNKHVVFSIADASKSFLNADSTIAIYNGSLDIWKGMLLFLVGTVFVIWALVADRNRS